MKKYLRMSSAAVVIDALKVTVNKWMLFGLYYTAAAFQKLME